MKKRLLIALWFILLAAVLIVTYIPPENPTAAEKPKGQKMSGSARFTHEIGLDASAKQAETTTAQWRFPGLDDYSTVFIRIGARLYECDSAGVGGSDSLIDTVDDSIKVMAYTGSESGYFDDSDAAPFWTATFAIVDSDLTILELPDFDDSGFIADWLQWSVVTLVDDSASNQSDSTVTYEVYIEQFAR
ncbi:MAG: hypothetical protein PVJ60_00580 [Phycisphaerales bacterium]|jgi:hypothetical protein